MKKTRRCFFALTFSISALKDWQFGIIVENQDLLILKVQKSRGRWCFQTCQSTLSWFSCIPSWMDSHVTLTVYCFLSIFIYLFIYFLPLEGNGPLKKTILAVEKWARSKYLDFLECTGVVPLHNQWAEKSGHLRLS